VVLLGMLLVVVVMVTTGAAMVWHLMLRQVQWQALRGVAILLHRVTAGSKMAGSMMPLCIWQEDMVKLVKLAT
jgi:hypothetical protein